MRLFTFSLCFFCLISCSTEDNNDIDCTLFDPENFVLYIELVDHDGNNLIENETYIADEIKIVFGDYTMNNVIYYDSSSKKNLIAFSLIGAVGDNTFKIQLSDELTDTLVLNLKDGGQVCGWSFLLLNTASYNGQLQTIKKFKGNNHLITVVK